MKRMNKVMAAMMIMAITAAMPAMAGNKKHFAINNNAKVVLVMNNFDKRGPHFDRHHRPAHHPDMRVCVFRVSHHEAPHHMVAKAERIHGVIDAHFNPRTHEVIVRYDARRTTAHHIRHFMASHHHPGRFS